MILHKTWDWARLAFWSDAALALGSAALSALVAISGGTYEPEAGSEAPRASIVAPRVAIRGGPLYLSADGSATARGVRWEVHEPAGVKVRHLTEDGSPIRGGFGVIQEVADAPRYVVSLTAVGEPDERGDVATDVAVVVIPVQGASPRPDPLPPGPGPEPGPDPGPGPNPRPVPPDPGPPSPGRYGLIRAVYDAGAPIALERPKGRQEAEAFAAAYAGVVGWAGTDGTIGLKTPAEMVRETDRRATEKFREIHPGAPLAALRAWDPVAAAIKGRLAAAGLRETRDVLAAWDEIAAGFRAVAGRRLAADTIDR